MNGDTYSSSRGKKSPASPVEECANRSQFADSRRGPRDYQVCFPQYLTTRLILTRSISLVEAIVTIVATDTVTATDAARDHQVEATAGTTITHTLPVAPTETGSAKIATLAANVATVVTVVTVTDLSEDGIVIEGRPAATHAATTSSGSTGGTETLTTTDVVVEGTIDAMMEDLEGKRVAGLLRRHPRRENPPQT